MAGPTRRPSMPGRRLSLRTTTKYESRMIILQRCDNERLLRNGGRFGN